MHHRFAPADPKCSGGHRIIVVAGIAEKQPRLPERLEITGTIADRASAMITQTLNPCASKTRPIMAIPKLG